MFDLYMVIFLSCDIIFIYFYDSFCDVKVMKDMKMEDVYN